MIFEWLIIITFWVSYLVITFASVITISDFVQKVAQSRKTTKTANRTTEGEPPSL